MKKLLLALAVGILSIPPHAKAYTAKELAEANSLYELTFINGTKTVGSEIIETITTPKKLADDGQYRGFEYTSCGNVMAYMNGDYLEISGIIGGEFFADFTVSGDKITLIRQSSSNYYFLGLSRTTKPVTGEATVYASSYPYFVLQASSFNTRNKQYSSQNSVWSGTITGDAETGYTIKMNPVYIYFLDNYGNKTGNAIYYDSIEYYFPPTMNASFSDTYNNKDRKYNAIFDLDLSNNRFEIINMMCGGYAINHPEDLYLKNGYYVTTKLPVYGTLYPTSSTSGTFTLGKKQGVVSDPEYYNENGYQKTRLYDYFLTPSGATTTDAQVTGTYNWSDIAHKDEIRWHKNSGGSLITYKKITMDFGDLQKRNQSRQHNVGPYYNTKLSAAVELTANPTFGNYLLGHTVDRISLAANIVEENEEFVDSYELIVLPYVVKTINDDSKFNHSDELHGHSKAINLNKQGSKANYFLGAVQPVSRAAISQTKTLMGYEMFYPELEAAGWDATDMANAKAGKMSIYIKANYNNGLEPTYHNLTPALNLTTGVELIEAINEVAAKVTSVPGGIEVTGYDGAVEVYSASGSQVYSGTVQGVIPVSQGMYIVKLGTKAHKVLVK